MHARLCLCVRVLLRGIYRVQESVGVCQVSNVLTDVIGGQDRASNKDTTLPYDIRAEIDWHDFACTANPLGAPERIKDAIASAIAEGAMTFRPDEARRASEQQSGALLRISPNASWWARALRRSSPTSHKHIVRATWVYLRLRLLNTILLLPMLVTIRSSS